MARAIEPSGALIVIAYDEAGTAALAAVPPEVPMVAMVETPAGDEGHGKPWVWLDDRRAALEATRYLLGLGHPTVHYLAIPSSTHTSQRQAGWRSALEEAGAPVPEPVQCGWTPQSGCQAAQPPPIPDVTAVLCGNDDLALGLMRAMQEAGRAIPADVSVVGFDDTPVAGFLTPSLTTVRMDFAELGRASFALLQALLFEPEPPCLRHLARQPELIIRESAGPPRLPRGS